MQNTSESQSYNSEQSYLSKNDVTHKNRLILLIGILSAVVLVLGISLVAYVLMANTNTSGKDSQKAPVVSAEDIQRNLSDVDVATNNSDISVEDVNQTLSNYNKQPKASE